MLNKNDLKLIRELRQDAREGPTKIAMNVCMSPSTVYEKARNHKQIITKYTCLLNYNEIDYLVRVFMIFKVDKELKDKSKDFLENNNNVNLLWKINSGFDFLIEGVFKNLAELENFREFIETEFKASKMSLFYLVEELKRESFVP